MKISVVYLPPLPRHSGHRINEQKTKNIQFKTKPHEILKNIRTMKRSKPLGVIYYMSWKQFRLFTECCFTGGTRHAARRSFITLKPVSLQNLDGPDPVIKIRSTPTSRTLPNLNNNGIPYFLNDQSGRTIVQLYTNNLLLYFPPNNLKLLNFLPSTTVHFANSSTGFTAFVFCRVL